MSVIRLAEILRNNETLLLDRWLVAQISQTNRSLITEAELRSQAKEFLQLLIQGVTEADITNIQGSGWTPIRKFLEDLSSRRAVLGFTPAETATFVFSFKQVLFQIIRTSISEDPEGQLDEMWKATLLLDSLGLYTTEVHQKARESVIARQQQEMLELSTPVVKLWNGVLALPVIGTLDSGRTQTIMENLLQMIVETGSDTAIIDITGVPTVDTLTAQHLLKTITAARLMGAECIISGIRPQIAQTIVHLGVDLGDVVTKASLADAFRLALQKTGYQIAIKK